jgi:cytochrome P450
MGLTFRHAFKLWSRPLPFLNWLRKFGDLIFFRMFLVRAYIVNHPDIIRDVMVAKRESFRKLPRDSRAIQQLLGNGILISDGDLWLRQRRLVQKAFHASRMPGYARTMAGETERILAEWQPNTEIDVATEMSRLNMRIGGQTLLGVDLEDTNRNLTRAAQQLTEAFIREASAVLRLPDWLPLPSIRRKLEGMRMYDELIRGIIARRRASGEDRGDLLSLLLKARDDEGDGGGMTDQQIRDEAMTLFTASFHANSASLAWTFYLLATHPEVERRVVEEAQQVLGAGVAGHEAVARMPYIQQVLKESLRLYPPASVLFRREAVQDVELGGYTVKRGSWILVYPYVTHRDERFYPEPLRFDPERFSPEREKQVPPYAYFPFGAGPRVCVGNMFAMMEMALILATIVRRYRLELPADHEPVEEQAGLALKPRKLRMVLRPRRTTVAAPIDLQTHLDSPVALV